MPVVGTNVSPVAFSASGGAALPNAPNDIWSLDIRGSLPDNVATSSTFLFRQDGAYDPADNPAADLFAAFFTVVGNSWDLLAALLSDSFAAQCCVIRNTSREQSFTNTFNIAGGEGLVVGGEVNSTNTVFRLKYMDDLVRLSARKSIYLPGVDQSFIDDSMLTVAGEGLANAFIDSLYTIQGPLNPWTWSYSDGTDDPQGTAANGHMACYLGRLKSRSPALC